VQVGDLVRYENVDGIIQYGIITRSGLHSAMVSFSSLENESWVSTEYLEVVNASR